MDGVRTICERERGGDWYVSALCPGADEPIGCGVVWRAEDGTWSAETIAGGCQEHGYRTRDAAAGWLVARSDYVAALTPSLEPEPDDPFSWFPEVRS